MLHSRNLPSFSNAIFFSFTIFSLPILQPRPASTDGGGPLPEDWKRQMRSGAYNSRPDDFHRQIISAVQADPSMFLGELKIANDGTLKILFLPDGSSTSDIYFWREVPAESQVNQVATKLYTKHLKAHGLTKGENNKQNCRSILAASMQISALRFLNDTGWMESAEKAKVDDDVQAAIAALPSHADDGDDEATKRAIKEKKQTAATLLANRNKHRGVSTAQSLLPQSGPVDLPPAQPRPQQLLGTLRPDPRFHPLMQYGFGYPPQGMALGLPLQQQYQNVFAFPPSSTAAACESNWHSEHWSGDKQLSWTDAGARAANAAI